MTAAMASNPASMRDQELLAKLAMQASAGHNPMLASLFGSPPGMPPGWQPGQGIPPGLMLPPHATSGYPSMPSPHHQGGASPAHPGPSPIGAGHPAFAVPPMSPHGGAHGMSNLPSSSSSFGSSLAALSRTAQSYVTRGQEAEERARKVNMMGMGVVTPPPRSPTTSNTSNGSSNQGVEALSPLLRHEHTHTHLHLGFNLSSPTHNS